MTVLSDQHHGFLLLSLSLRVKRSAPLGPLPTSRDISDLERENIDKQERRAKVIAYAKLRRSMRRHAHQGHRQRGFRYYNG